MNRKLRNWIASPAEARTAWLIAAICVVLIATAFILPGVHEPAPKSTAAQEERHSITTESRQDESHSDAIEKLIEKAQQEDPQATNDEPVETVAAKPEPAPAPEPVVTKPKPAPVKEPVSANQTVTASSDTASIAAILARAQMEALAKGYYVQLGAFSKQSGAESLQKKLSAKLNNTHVKKKSNGMYAVWAGPYTTKKLAEQARADITRRTGIKGYTVSN